MANPTRRDARERAVELLYEAETKSRPVGEVIAELAVDPDAYAEELARGAWVHAVELDAVLGRFARDWDVARMAVTDRIVLRLGVLELAVQADVPTGVVLSEAVELASRYGSTDDTSRFVNGILAAVADEVRDGDRPWTPIDVVVFDMDGVLRHWDVESLRDAEARLGLPPGVVGAAAFASPRFGDATEGRITAEEWAAQIGAAVAADHEVDAGAVEALWLASRWEVDPTMVDLVAEIRAGGTRVALLSNASTRLEVDLATMGLESAFDLVANSSRLGMSKPDPAIYDEVAGRLGVDAERILFVDDRQDNVASAIDTGWHAVVMPGADELRRVLRRLGVPGVAQPA